MTRFEGLTAVVTGGANGIGGATARRLASEGATVVVADFDEEGAKQTAAEIGGVAVRCDVTNLADVEAAVETAKDRGGSVDILVTCAGIIRDNLLFKMTDDDWNAVIDTHLKGTFHAVRAAQKHMVEQKSGKMVLISSTSALGNRGQTNYSTAKAGLQGMTKTLALELGPFGVNVNCVAPGFIATEMVASVPEEALAKVVGEIPVGRLGEPEEVARVVEFLVDRDAGYITGTVVSVNGGLNM